MNANNRGNKESEASDCILSPFPKPKNGSEKEYNERMTEKAEALRCRRYESIVNERYDFFDKEKERGDFLLYFKNLALKKNVKWNPVYKHF